MEKHIRVENNEVVECMNADELPEFPQGDWRVAIFVEPEIIPNRQIKGSHRFDLTKNPVEILYDVIDLTIEDRKENLIGILCLDIDFQLEQEIKAEQPNIQNITNLLSQKTQIKTESPNLQTHEEIDQYTETHS